MVRYSNLSFIALLFTLLIEGSLFTVFGQPIWLDRSADKAITLEILKPNFADEDETTFNTSAWFLSGRFTVSNTISLVGQIPFVHYGEKGKSSNAFGNIYAGIEIHGRNSPVFGEIGVYLHTAPSEYDVVGKALFVGSLTDLDRWEAFLRDEVVIINTMINYYQKNPGGLVLRFRGGHSIWIWKDNENETMLLYAAQVGYAAPKFELLSGFSGRWLVNRPADNFGQATWHQLGFAANVALGNFRPGITFRMPIDEDYSDWMDFVFGLTLGINLP